MKDFVKLTKETWQFYLTSLCIALLPVVSNNIYVLKELKPDGESKQILYSMADIFFDKADGYDLVNFWVALFGMILLLFVRHFSFMDRRAMEFEMFLPVKKRIVVIHDYIFSLGVIVIPWLVTMCTFAIAQSKNNNAVIAVNGVLKGETVNADSEFLKTGLYYLLYLVCAFTFFYLGIVICKNGIVGMAIMAAVWGTVYFMVEIPDTRAMFGNLLTPEFFLDYIYHTPYEKKGLLNLVGITVLMILFIIIAAEKRELSRGKWFYFPLLDYLLPILCGIFAANICYAIFWVAELVSVIVGAAICGLLLLMMKWDKHGKSDRLEVK
ncbi:MAG: hypothetical protein K2L07_07870 [Lachnospiraceae bacterium]|nr:hypothetical protein [Lachnospiraceae bacterium]